MKQSKGNVLKIIQDAAEYFLHIVTLVGPMILFGYSIWYVISNESWNAVLFVVVAVSLLAVNVFMRMTTTGPPGGDRPGAG